MEFVEKNYKWVMLVSGFLTATMFYGLIAPQAALESMFGASFNGGLESIIVRSWSALVGIVGLILICGALVERYRVLSASVGALSKTIFVSLVMIYGQEYLGQAAPVIILDVVVVLTTLIYFAAVWVKRSAV